MGVLIYSGKDISLTAHVYDKHFRKMDENECMMEINDEISISKKPKVNRNNPAGVYGRPIPCS